MRQPIFVRPLTEEEGSHLEDGLRSSDVMILRRCQIPLATAPAKSEYQGKTYYFCAPGCKSKFERDPGKYVAGLGSILCR
jgi:YHS domain-containing protein